MNSFHVVSKKNTSHTIIPRCIAPFLSLGVWVEGNPTCCPEDKGEASEKRLNDVDDVMDLVNSKRMGDIRKQFMNHEIPSGCAACLRESKHQPMVYYWFHNKFSWKDLKPHYDPISGKIDQIRNLIVALSNTCSFSCRMCYEQNSSRLNHDRTRIYGDTSVKNNQNDIGKILKCIKDNPIEYITFHGGNALNDPHFIEVLEALDDNTTVEIITNGSTLTVNGEHVFPHLRRFKAVHFILSLDGTKPYTEYIRVHSNFDTVLAHFREIRSLPNATINIHNTISNLNVFNLPEYYTMILTSEFAAADTITSYLINKPKMYSVFNLPDTLRKKAQCILEKYLYDIRLNFWRYDRKKVTFIEQYVTNVIRRMNSVAYDDNLFKEFLHHTKRIDEFYGFQPAKEFREFFISQSMAVYCSTTLSVLE